MKKNSVLLIVLVILILAVVVGIILLNTNNNKGKVKLETAEDIKNMLTTVYSNAKVELPGLDTSVIDVSDEIQVTSFTGLKSNENIKELVVSVPFINAQAYLLSVIKVDNKANIEKLKQEIYDNIDMRMWVCVSAEKLYITSYDDIIFVVMSSEEWAKPVYDEFKNFAGGKVGKELEKTESSDYELPPDMLAE